VVTNQPPAIDSCGPIVSVLDDILLHSQNSAALDSAHALLRTLTTSPQFTGALDSSGVLNDILEDMGFSGIWRSCSLNLSHDQDKECFALTEKLIEVSPPPCQLQCGRADVGLMIYTSGLC
jgi:neurofibromin 1